MSYLHQFGPDDVFHNQLKTHPQFKVTLYSGSAYINDRREANIQSGSIDLYETLSGSYPFSVKDGTATVVRTTSRNSFNTTDYGTTLDASYPLTSSVDREMIQTNGDRKNGAAQEGKVGHRFDGA